MDFKTQAVVVALEKLFSPSGHFSVTAVRDLAKVVGFVLPPADEALFSLLHCVDYRAMREGMREELAERVVALIRSAKPDFDFEARVAAPSVPSRHGFLRRIVGGPQ